VPTRGLTLHDGCGLSRLDRLTAGTLTGLLVAAARDPETRLDLVEALPVAGRRGRSATGSSASRSPAS